MNHHTNERLARPQRGEPAGRGVRERAAAARLHAPEDRGAGALRRQALRHLQDPPGLQRLRLQDTRQVRRPVISRARTDQTGKIEVRESIIPRVDLSIPVLCRAINDTRMMSGTTRRAPSDRRLSGGPSRGLRRTL